MTSHLLLGSVLPLTVVNSYAGASQARVVPSTSYTPNRHKRSYEEDEEMDAQTQQNENVSGKKNGYVFITACKLLSKLSGRLGVFFPPMFFWIDEIERLRAFS